LDCDDDASWVNPAGLDVWYDGEDTDCGGEPDYDADADGFDYDLYGGDDCDDSTFAVNPAVLEIPYDGVDQDCSGSDMTDMDGDGHHAEIVGGDDCNDGSDTIHPGAVEAYDFLDNDCDVLVDEDAVLYGDLQISEIMANPSFLPDDEGEYFEIYNSSDMDINMIGWTIADMDADSFTIEDDLFIESGEYVVFSVHSTSAVVDVVYDYSDFKLTNSIDEIVLWAGDDEKAQVEWVATTEGVAMGFELGTGDWDDTSVWCNQTTVMFSFAFLYGDYGTPGTVNDSCGGALIDPGY